MISKRLCVTATKYLQLSEEKRTSLRFHYPIDFYMISKRLCVTATKYLQLSEEKRTSLR